MTPHIGRRVYSPRQKREGRIIAPCGFGNWMVVYDNFTTDVLAPEEMVAVLPRRPELRVIVGSKS